MKRGISNQIIIIAIMPALIIAIILSAYFIHSQFNYISESLNKHGKSIAKQLSPAAEYSIYSGNTKIILPLIKSIIINKDVIRVQILNRNNKLVLDIKKPEFNARKNTPLLTRLFNRNKYLQFTAPVISKRIPVEDYGDRISSSNKILDSKIGQIIITLTTNYAFNEKISHIEKGVLITLILIIITLLIIIKISHIITKPIKLLSETVKDIALGNFDTQIKENSTGEIGSLQSCINHMTAELKGSHLSMENQLNEYTNELQQTMEELEIRNAELDITRSRAISANKAKSEFLANMSHEIRTPLSGIIGFTELLHSTKLSDQQADYTNTIKKSANNLLEIINDILDLSKIESGKTEINNSEFNLLDIIEDVINLLTPTAYEKNIELFYRIDNLLPNILRADPLRIHQIITNLVGNAIKFTETGYVYLQIEPGEIDNAEYNIKFTVIDTGIGMSRSDKKKLFKAFTQADATITRRFGGTGLGLVISKKLTLLMRGKIGFDSTLNKGSIFWFSIPVTPVNNEHDKNVYSPILIDKKIAFLATHIIGNQILKSILESWKCQVTELNIEDLISDKKSSYPFDATIIYLDRSYSYNDDFISALNQCNIPHPSLLIANTRSHEKLKHIQGNQFDEAIFISEKIGFIQQKLINLINHHQYNIEAIEIHNNQNITDWSDLKIMVVDDNDISLRLAEIILHKNRVNVTTAHSGEQAIDYAGKTTFDIIFMDLHMPGLDGYETSRQIKDGEKNKNSIIIALTANALTKDAEKISRAGMNDILIKPISDNVMHHVINQWTNKKTPVTIGHSASKLATDGIFSLDTASEFTGGNKKLALELFSMLRAELDDYTSKIKQAVKLNNREELKNIIHKLHGASRCCGTVKLKYACSEIENLVNHNVEFNLQDKTNSLLTIIQQVKEIDIDHLK